MSETAGGMRRIDSGEWAGWSVWQSDSFEQLAGPFYERIDDRGPVCAFRAAKKHLNGGGMVHGGCLQTFADSALFTIAHEALKGFRAVTLHLAGDFLDAARLGELLEARGDVTRAGKSTIFVRGLVTADARPVLSFNGILRKVAQRT